MFKAVKADKISESISQQIREAIFEDSLRPGDKLPSERELIKTFGVSRASMREALRSLEVLGFLEIRNLKRLKALIQAAMCFRWITGSG